MAITLRYNPAYENVLGMANETGQGNLRRQLEELARRDALDQQRLDESARQFDQGLQAQQYNQVANRGLAWANMAQDQYRADQQAYLAQQQLQARIAEQQMQNDAYAYGQDAQTQRAFGAEQARMAREAANRRFEKSMKDREVLLDQFNRGMLMPAQKQQAIANWEQQSGMSWGMPDEMAAQEDNQAMQDRVAALESTFFTHPITKEPLVSEGAVAKMLELGMDPKDITAQGLKLQSEARQTAALQQKEGEADRKLQEEDAKAQQKQQIEAAKESTKTMRDSIAGERAYRQAQEEYNQEVKQYEADLEEYEMAKSAHATMAASASSTGGAKPFTKTPPKKPVPPSPGLFADKIPTPRSRDEVDALLPGTRFIAPDGQIRVR